MGMGARSTQGAGEPRALSAPPGSAAGLWAVHLVHSACF